MNNFGDRWDNHRALLRYYNHSNAQLQIDWFTYGEDSFVFQVIDICEDLLTANHLEEQYIEIAKADGLSYNILSGGDSGPKGIRMKEETKRKIGEKNRINMTGRKLSDETKSKMSASQFARYEEWTDEQRAAWGRMISERVRDYKWSDDAKQRFAEKQRVKPNSAKYTPDDIRSIRARYADGVDKNTLASEYNTSPAYIDSIVKMRRWKYID